MATYVAANSFFENFGTLFCPSKNFGFNWNDIVPYLEVMSPLKTSVVKNEKSSSSSFLLPYFSEVLPKLSLSPFSPIISLTPKPFLSPYFPPLLPFYALLLISSIFPKVEIGKLGFVGL